jgi:hypothetical protein
MIENLLKILEMVEKYGPWALCGLISLWLLTILLDEDRSASLRAKIYKIIFRFTGRSDHEKKYIANDIRGKLNLARKELCPTKNALGKAVEVLWVEGGRGDAEDIKEGEFIIRLDPSAHQSHNIVLMATAVVKKTVMLGIRHSVETPLQTAIDLNVVRQILTKVSNKSALDWFLSSQYIPTIGNDSSVNDRNEQILALDERGLFTQILLIELEDFSRRICGMPPRPYMTGEVNGFVSFLYKIATKQMGHDVPLHYLTAFIRIGVVIVAKTSKVLNSIQPYVYAVQKHLQQEPYSIYVMAFDKDWLGNSHPDLETKFNEQVESLRTTLQDGTVAEQDFDIVYSCADQAGNRRKARCIRYVTPFD